MASASSRQKSVKIGFLNPMDIKGLTSRLKPALQPLNPEVPQHAIDGAMEELTGDRSALSLVEGNREG